MTGILALLLAAQLSVNASNFLELRLLRDGRERLINELSFDLFYDNFKAGFTFATYQPETLLEFQRRSEVLKKYIEYRSGPLTARGGYFYSTFGHGLLLYAARDEVLQMDRFVDGADLRLKFRGIKGEFLVGKPRVFEEYRLREDSLSLLQAVDLAASPLSFLKVGGSFLRASDSLRYLRSDFLAGRTELSVGPLNLYFEYAKRWGYNRMLKKKKNGAADYLSLSYSGAGLGLTFEFRDYWLFGKEYGIPPSLSKNGFYLNSAMDERGFSLKLDLGLIDGLDVNLYGSHLFSTEHFGPKSDLKELGGKADGYVGPLEYTLSLSYMNFEGAKDALGLDRRREIDPEATLILRLSDLYSISLYGRNRMRKDDDKKYSDIDAYLTFSLFSIIDLTLAGSKRTGDLEGKWGRIELFLHAGGMLDMILTYGSERGDFVCSGGICRYEPEFKGFKVKAAINF